MFLFYFNNYPVFRMELFLLVPNFFLIKLFTFIHIPSGGG